MNTYLVSEYMKKVNDLIKKFLKIKMKKNEIKLN